MCRGNTLKGGGRGREQQQQQSVSGKKATNTHGLVNYCAISVGPFIFRRFVRLWPSQCEPSLSRSTLEPFRIRWNLSYTEWSFPHTSLNILSHTLEKGSIHTIWKYFSRYFGELENVENIAHEPTISLSLARSFQNLKFETMACILQTNARCAVHSRPIHNIANRDSLSACTSTKKNENRIIFASTEDLCALFITSIVTLFCLLSSLLSLSRVSEFSFQRVARLGNCDEAELEQWATTRLKSEKLTVSHSTSTSLAAAAAAQWIREFFSFSLVGERNVKKEIWNLFRGWDSF